MLQATLHSTKLSKNCNEPSRKVCFYGQERAEENIKRKQKVFCSFSSYFKEGAGDRTVEVQPVG